MSSQIPILIRRRSWQMRSQKARYLIFPFLNQPFILDILKSGSKVRGELNLYILELWGYVLFPVMHSIVSDQLEIFRKIFPPKYFGNFNSLGNLFSGKKIGIVESLIVEKEPILKFLEYTISIPASTASTGTNWCINKIRTDLSKCKIGRGGRASTLGTDLTFELRFESQQYWVGRLRHLHQPYSFFLKIMTSTKLSSFI